MVATAPATGDWLVRLDKVPSPRRRVICFPNAGGSPTAFRRWVPELPADIELLAVQFPGRQKRIKEAPLRDLQQAVGGLVPALAPLLGPGTLVFGDCTGALVAYEALLAAREAGLPAPSAFLVACCRAPNLPCRHELLHRLSDDALMAEMGRLALAPGWLVSDVATFRSFLPLLRCDFELAEAYVRPGPANRLSTAITAVGATHDKVTPAGDVKAWQDYTSAEFEYVEFEAGHDLVTTHVRELVAMIDARAPLR